ncbi:dehydration-responsive element-binding protein 1F-like [Canna indica]|uniref:Dehydration-responsive element-binding protein 1F-like n=1 Tax=Canna indica TaxID=4628 RepID=A0AAQ3K7R7_9LILI|nr:dehydration-responsive element-binding protein 1F-like [Canna indica]
MDREDSSSSSSCASSSSSSSNQGPRRSAATSRPLAPSPKRKDGRKKFRETRHPVYHGVRARKGGRWVCEVREPRKNSRIWLGTFSTPEAAARAHDVAAIALRGDSAHLNFADWAWALPRARSAAAEDVRRAAAEAAMMFERRPDPLPESTSLPSLLAVGAAAEAGTSTTTPEPEGRRENAAAPPAVFLDDEALFNMPGLLEDMARGLLVTPPAMQRGFDWDLVEEGCHVDLSLWSLDDR